MNHCSDQGGVEDGLNPALSSGQPPKKRKKCTEFHFVLRFESHPYFTLDTGTVFIQVSEFASEKQFVILLIFNKIIAFI